MNTSKSDPMTRNSMGGGPLMPAAIVPILQYGQTKVAGQGSGAEEKSHECRGCSNCAENEGGCHQDESPGQASHSSSMLNAPTHVLSTLEQDGSRRWLWPRLAKGQWWQRRRWVGYALIAFFVALPHLRYAGKPPVLLDIPARQLTVMGKTFLPTDTLLLAFGMLGVFLTIMAVTTITGRLWCGWGCPQTVYMEFVFRPIDRFFEGTVGRGGKPKRSITGILAVARFGVYLILAMLLAHTFLSYFVGTDRLAMWIRSTPTQHPIAFMVMIATTAGMLFDFMFFREQMCLIACPYGRFQSVMLDRRSLIVGYDPVRGEPRGKLQKRQNAVDAVKGDCVDCKACVAVCPTGIDIRDGLQMECINCTQCIDACDTVMDKIGKPRGLIRYSSQDGLQKKASSSFRPRLFLYPTLLVLVLSAFLFVLSRITNFDASTVRGAGNPYTSIGGSRIQNSIKLRLVNRSGKPQTYSVAVASPGEVTVEVMDPESLTLNAGGNRLIPLSLSFPSHIAGQGGHVMTTLAIKDGDGFEKAIEFQLLGPKL